MARKIKLTDARIGKLKSGDVEYMVWDTRIAGFGLRVRASGRKYYVVQFRANGRLRRMTLGRHGAVTPETARRRAMALISDAKGGKDPAALRDKGRMAATMKVLGKRFLEEYVPVHCKPSTAYEYQRSVKFFIDPRIGTRKVTEIQRSDIAELHHGMRETPYQANRTLGVLSKMFNLAELWGLRPDGSNPCLHVKRYKEEKRERFLSAEEFTRLGQVLDEILGDGSETRSAVAAIRLLMLTGCRLSEIQKLRWEHVDLDAGELRLPDTKTGGRAVPLAPSAVRLLTSLPRDEDNPWVIAGRKPGSHLTDLQHPWRRIRGRAGLDDVRIHDLHHSFASRALALGEGLPMIGKLLGHSDIETTARYAHLARDSVHEAAERIADSIAADILLEVVSQQPGPAIEDGRLTRKRSRRRGIRSRRGRRLLRQVQRIFQPASVPGNSVSTFRFNCRTNYVRRSNSPDSLYLNRAYQIVRQPEV